MSVGISEEGLREYLGLLGVEYMDVLIWNGCKYQCKVHILICGKCV